MTLRGDELIVFKRPNEQYDLFPYECVSDALYDLNIRYVILVPEKYQLYICRMFTLVEVLKGITSPRK